MVIIKIAQLNDTAVAAAFNKEKSPMGQRGRCSIHRHQSISTVMCDGF